MEVGIKVLSEDFKLGVAKHTNTSYFTMVAVDEETRRPSPVPGLILEEDIEVKRFIRGKLRKQYKRDHQEHFNSLSQAIDFDQEIKNLKDDNCSFAAIA